MDEALGEKVSRAQSIAKRLELSIFIFGLSNDFHKIMHNILQLSGMRHK